MSIQFSLRRVSSQVLLAILEIQRNDRPRISYLSYLMHRQAQSSYFQELTCMVKAWFQLSYFFSTNRGVVQKVCLPTFNLTYVPFLILFNIMASTTVVFKVLLGALLQSFILASFFLSQKMLISTFPLFLLIKDISNVKSLLMSSFSLRQMRLTPRNFFMPLTSHHDSVMILSIQDYGNLKVSLKMYSPSLLKIGSFQVWQFSSPYFSTKKGVPVMSLGPKSSNLIDLIAISRAGTCTTFSILISETSINAILCLSLLKISTRQLGISGLLKSSTPDPINLYAQKTDRVRWGSWSWRSKMESQLQRCLSEGMKYGLIFFQALPIFMRKVGIYQKVLDFMHTRQSQLFFMGLLYKYGVKMVWKSID